MKIISTNKDQKKKQTVPRKVERAPRAKPVKKWDITANLINNIWDAWIVTDLKLKVLNWNTAAEKIYGWKQHEILNQPLTKFIKTEYLTGTNSEDALQQVLECGHWQGDVIQNRKDGSRFTVMSSVSLIKDDNGKSVGFVAINRDITESKRAEEKLLQYKKILDETNDAVFLIDTETSKYIDLNLAACKMLGYSCNELIQLGAIDIAQHITSMQYWHKRVEMVREQKGLIFETNYQRKDKTTFPVEISARMMSDAEKDVMIAVVRDITRRKQDEAALQQSESLYRLLAENSSDAVSLFNADGKTLYMSPAYGKLLGYAIEDMLNIGLAEIVQLIHPEDRKRIFQQIIEGHQHKLPYSQYAYRVLTKQGGYIWLEDVLHRELDENGQIIRIIINTRNIAKRKQDEEVLRKNAEQFRNLAENIPSVIYVLDLTTYKVVYLNQENFLGYDRLDLTRSESILSELHPEDAPQVMAQWQQVIIGGKAEPIEYRLRSKAGIWEWVQGNSAVMSHTPDGAVKEMVIVLTVITNRKQAEEDLRQRNLQFNSLLQIGIELTSELDLNKLLESISVQACELLGTSGGGVYLYRAELEKLELVVAIGAHNTTRGALLERGQGLSGRVWELEQPLVVDDYEVWTGRAAIYEGTPFKAVVGVPIRRGDEFLGVLTLLADPPRRFSQQDINLLGYYAAIAAVAIYNARLYQNVQKRLSQLEVLYATSKAFSSEFDLNILLKSVVKNARQLLNAATSGMYLVIPSTDELELSVDTAPYIPLGSRIRFGEGMAGLVAQTRQPLRLDDYSTWEGRAEIYEDAPIRAVLEVPMFYRGELIGVLTADESGESKRKFTEEDERLLSLFASQAASAIKNAKLFDSLQISNAELTQAYDATIAGWSRAMDLRDKETEGHTVRVSELALRLARAMGIDESEIVHMRRGGLLHDIGKLGIPDNILLKDGKLTDEEWVIMRRHPTYAYEMLSQIDYLKPALIIPYCHHERWDGTGYPRGLKGEDIPLAARIFAFADVWDALRSDRPYRAGWSVEKVIEHIKSQAGTHFDPAIAEVFIDLMTEKTIKS